VIAIIGNKNDLAENEIVDENDAKKYAESIGGIFYSTSAKDINCIKNVFNDLAKIFINHGQNFEITDSFRIRKKTKKKKNKKCNCH
jgi:hypothetical protein